MASDAWSVARLSRRDWSKGFASKVGGTQIGELAGVDPERGREPGAVLHRLREDLVEGRVERGIAGSRRTLDEGPGTGRDCRRKQRHGYGGGAGREELAAVHRRSFLKFEACRFGRFLRTRNSRWSKARARSSRPQAHG
jgi:hypothetical protein